MPSKGSAGDELSYSLRGWMAEMEIPDGSHVDSVLQRSIHFR